MDRLKLDMSQARADERRQRRILAVEKALQRIEAFVQAVRRRRHEQSVAGPRPADPILRAAELARLLRSTPPRFEQDGVHLADQPERQGEALPQAGNTMFNRRDVIRDLGHVV